MFRYTLCKTKQIEELMLFKLNIPRVHGVANFKQYLALIIIFNFNVIDVY